MMNLYNYHAEYQLIELILNNFDEILKINKLTRLNLEFKFEKFVKNYIILKTL